MKPSKNQTDQGVKKKKLNESKSSSKIKKYFKSVPQPFVNEDKGIEINDCGNARAVYIDSLKKKLEESEDAGANREGASSIGGESEERGGGVVLDNQKNNDAVTDLENASECSGCNQKDVEYQHLETKYKELKKAHVKLSLSCSELHIKYDDLLKTKTQTVVLDVNDGAVSNDDVFTLNEIKSLQRISLEKKKDSTFILQGLQYAYKEDLSVLSSKSLKGKSESMQVSEEGEVEYIPGKDPLTPKKVDRLKDLFIERISKCDVNAVGFGERIKDSNFNKLIASGIINIAKKN